MILNKIIGFVFYCINILWWTAGKYLLFRVEEQNHQDCAKNLDNGLNQWKELEDNEMISLSQPDIYQSRNFCTKKMGYGGLG